MGNLLRQLIVVGALVLLNAAFAGTELALVSLREGQLQRLEQRSPSGRVLASLARQPNQFLATVQIGITLAGFLASAAAAVSLAEPLVGPLGFLGDAARPVAVVVVTLLLTYVTLVFGELAPKRIAMQRAERWGLVMARPLAWLSTVTRPIVWLLSRSTDVVVRIAGGDPDLQRSDVTEEDLREMVAAQPTLTDEQRFVIDGAFEIAERTIAEVLVPRRDVFALNADEPCRHALEGLAVAGHSRAPVTAANDLDEVIGVAHVLRLLDGGDDPVWTRMSDIATFPDSAKALKVLRSMQDARAPMALIVDEHGASQGVVTIEDLVEEIVGEIYDETDRNPLTVRRHPDGTIDLPGRFPIHDLADIGIDVPPTDATTIAGLALEHLGHIPSAVPQTVDIGEWRITITDIDHRAITSVRLQAARRPG